MFTKNNVYYKSKYVVDFAFGKIPEYANYSMFHPEFAFEDHLDEKDEYLVVAKEKFYLLHPSEKNRFFSQFKIKRNDRL